jgi:hypothetical protein
VVVIRDNAEAVGLDFAEVGIDLLLGLLVVPLIAAVLVVVVVEVDMAEFGVGVAVIDMSMAGEDVVLQRVLVVVMVVVVLVAVVVVLLLLLLLPLLLLVGIVLVIGIVLVRLRASPHPMPCRSQQCCFLWAGHISTSRSNARPHSGSADELASAAEISDPGGQPTLTALQHRSFLSRGQPHTVSGSVGPVRQSRPRGFTGPESS